MQKVFGFCQEPFGFVQEPFGFCKEPFGFDRKQTALHRKSLLCVWQTLAYEALRWLPHKLSLHETQKK